MTIEHDLATTSDLGYTLSGERAHSWHRQNSGTVVLRIQEAEFKVSAGLLHGKSTVFSNAVGPDVGNARDSYTLVSNSADWERVDKEREPQTIRTAQQVRSTDFEVLLGALLDE